MLDMGFLPAIRRIVAALPSKRQTLLFSATLSAEIERIAQEFLTAPAVAQIGTRSTPAEAVTQVVVEVGKADKIDALLHLLKDAALEMVLVFSRTKHGADKLARKLASAGIATATLHSNRTQGQRLVALKRFRSGEVRVLVATDIAARGIDVDGISHVVNFDFPPQPEDYVHRIGRTGRAHAIGDAISFVTPDDRGALRSLERFLGRGLPRHPLEGWVRRVRPAIEGDAARPATRREGAHPPRRADRRPDQRPERRPDRRHDTTTGRAPSGPRGARSAQRASPGQHPGAAPRHQAPGVGGHGDRRRERSRGRG
jgi:ATP-dependent RNA helicase RhlE